MTIEELSRLSDEELRVMCAELCGWRDVQKSDRWNDFTATPPSPGKSILNRYDVSRPYLPNWTADLNAMHEAEESLSDIDQMLMHSFLTEVVELPGKFPGGVDYSKVRPRVWRATARQRCIALIAVKQPTLTTKPTGME